jgi:spore coat polysaccharide biosynthesis protein SpsF
LKTAVIIQARAGSSRLPGKVLELIGKQSVLEHVIKRCQKIERVNVVCCAVPDNASDDVVADLAQSLGAVVYRGSEQDVLNRYAEAAKMLSVETIMRVTSDCPLIDYQICGKVLKLLNESGCDYVSNNLPPSFPHGLDCEAFTVESLLKADEYAVEEYDREHVTPWIRNSDAIRKKNLLNADSNVSYLRWTLDFEEDLNFFRELNRYLQLLPGIPDYKQILSVINDHPELIEINRHRIDESRLEIN